MTAFDVTVTLDQDDIRVYLVHADSEEEAEKIGKAEAASLLDAKALRLNYPEKVDAIDYDNVLAPVKQ